MTHDELLEKIGEAVGWEDKRPDGKTVLVIDYDDSPITQALRAVVELTNNLQDTESWQDNAEYNAGYNNAMYEVIQAIEKELK